MGDLVDLTDLDKDISEEVKESIWRLGANKAAGPDVFLIFFYKHFWETIKVDIMKLMWELDCGTSLD